MKLKMLLMAALFAASATGAPAQDVVPGKESETEEILPADVPAAVTDLDVSVINVRIVGPWSTADGRGFSRVVLTVTQDTPHLYVQWVERPLDAEPHVLMTVEIEDVARDRLLFGDMRVEADENDAEVVMDTVPGADGLRQTYVLLIGEPSNVRFGPATN